MIFIYKEFNNDLWPSNLFAVKSAGSNTKNGRDSPGKRLGLKVNNDQFINAGTIIYRQRGLKFRPGENVGLGKDFTIFAMKSGIVKFHQVLVKKKYKNKDTKKIRYRVISVVV